MRCFGVRRWMVGGPLVNSALGKLAIHSATGNHFCSGGGNGCQPIDSAAAVALLRYKRGVMPVLLKYASGGWAPKAVAWHKR